MKFSTGAVPRINNSLKSGILTGFFPFSVLISLFVAGCVPTWTSTGETIEESQLADLRTGITTKWQILEYFGPPAAIIRPEDKTVSLPATNVKHIMAGTIGYGGKFSVQPIIYLEALEIKTLRPEQRIYCFQHARDRVVFVSGGVGFGEMGGISREELIVLINEESELVEGWYYSD